MSEAVALATTVRRPLARERLVQFDDETWEALVALSRRKGKTFQRPPMKPSRLSSKKHKQPVGLMTSLKESVGARSKRQRRS
jgi:hypothetical protein